MRVRWAGGRASVCIHQCLLLRLDVVAAGLDDGDDGDGKGKNIVIFLVLNSVFHWFLHTQQQQQRK